LLDRLRFATSATSFTAATSSTSASLAATASLRGFPAWGSCLFDARTLLLHLRSRCYLLRHHYFRLNLLLLCRYRDDLIIKEIVGTTGLRKLIHP
jgi:hypothetical protein